MNDPLYLWLEQQGFSAHGTPADILQARIANSTTPLMHAARMGLVGYVDRLLALGADPAAMNADNNGALWFACFADCLDCLRGLICAGAPLNTRNINGATALIYAASAGKTAVVSLLLQAGADATLQTLDGFTALDLAANRPCMKLLRQAQAKSPAPFEAGKENSVTSPAADGRPGHACRDTP